MSKWFCWKVTRDTFIGFAAGICMIVLSLLMLPFSGGSVLDEIMSVFLRDVCMIFGLGIVFVSYECGRKGKEGWRELGFHKKKWLSSLILNVFFAVALLSIFMKEGKPGNLLTIENFYGAIYILVAGIFEMLFIYGFLRMTFEKAFGMVPAILLTAAFYSLHHAGFQPEFFHLFFVGVMYAAVFYITHNMLVIFPLFWAVGALWDVLVDSSAGNEIKNLFSFIVAIGILVLAGLWLLVYNQWRVRVAKQ